MIQTQWCVITGAPSSGKTTLINQLANQGARISPEVARDRIQQELLTHHQSFAEIQQDLLQQSIADIMCDRESLFPYQETIYFDRGLPDSLAYYRFHQINTTGLEKRCKNFRYFKVFFCQTLPVAEDPIRIEGDLEAKTIGQYIHEAYSNLGYDLIELPALSVVERLKIIREHQD